MLEIFGLLGWGIVLIFSVLAIVCLEFDSPGLTFVSLVAGLGFLVGAENAWTIPSVTGIFAWLDHNWFRLIVFAALYVGAGAAWSVVKWFFYVHNRADDYEKNRDEYRKEFEQAAAGRLHYYKDPRTDTFGHFVADRYDFPPSPLKNKARIMSWMWYWPWSALYTLLNDPIRRAFAFAYRRMTAIFSYISASVFGKYSELQ